MIPVYACFTVLELAATDAYKDIEPISFIRVYNSHNICFLHKVPIGFY